jgi:hypothetical protein
VNIAEALAQFQEKSFRISNFELQVLAGQWVRKTKNIENFRKSDLLLYLPAINALRVEMGTDLARQRVVAKRPTGESIANQPSTSLQTKYPKGIKAEKHFSAFTHSSF